MQIATEYCVGSKSSVAADVSGAADLDTSVEGLTAVLVSAAGVQAANDSTIASARTMINTFFILVLSSFYFFLRVQEL
jgi:hypothetical protein